MSPAMETLKKFFVEPVWELRRKPSILDIPIPGYETVVPSPPTGLLGSQSRAGRFRHALVRYLADPILPMGFMRSVLQTNLNRPEDTVLTYAIDHVVLRKEPWVLELEYASHLIGRYYLMGVGVFRAIVAHALASPYCKRILCWSEAGAKTILAGLGSERLAQKIELVYWATTPKPFVKEFGNERVKLLFVGSVSAQGQFDMKGGRDVLAAFELLRQRYPRLELVIRSEVPEDVKQQWGQAENVRIIDKPLPTEAYHHELQTADIAMLPFYDSSAHSFLEAMSFELPVVGRRIWATPEYIEDGRTGLLAKTSKKLEYYWRNTCHPSYFESATFQAAIRKADAEVVADLVAKVSLLIENVELRRKLGRAGRHEVEHGRFSMQRLAAQLKRVFDEATALDS